MKFSKKAGFSSIVGFIFAFFAMVIVFSSIFVIYNEQLFEQIALLESRGSEYSDSTLYGYDLKNPFYSSGRLLVELDNEGLDLQLLEENSLCFSFFYDDLFFPENRAKITIEGNLASTYAIIEESEKGYIHMITSDDTNDHTIKAISCGGIEEFEAILDSNKNWWNENWESRNKILVENNAAESLSEYQVVIDLNISNFDFSLGREQDLRVVLPYKENAKLDLTFDSYSQQLNDYSNYDNTVFLGTGAGVEASDPISAEGILFDAISFDGGDFLTVSSDSSLEIDNSITILSWVKWDSSGDTMQYIYKNGETGFGIVNDGGANDNKLFLEVNIGGTPQTLYSTSTLDSQWHFVSATFDGADMRLYIDSTLDNNVTQEGNITAASIDNYIGYNGTTNFYSGDLDEFKVFNTPLDSSAIQDAYYGKLRFDELDYHIGSFDSEQQLAKIFAKVPSIGESENVTIELYYNNDKGVSTTSNIESTFRYVTPRTVGYVVGEKLATDRGLRVTSLYDDNTIIVDDDTFNLDELVSGTLGTGSVNIDDIVQMKYLAQVEGNSADGGDIIVPISWASREFASTRFRDNDNHFCTLSPFGSTTINIYLSGVFSTSSVVDETGFCFDLNDLGDNERIYMNASLPFLVSEFGEASDRNSHVYYPLSTGTFYGVPSEDLRFAAGQTAATISYFTSLGDVGADTLAAFDLGSDTNNGGDNSNNAAAYRMIVSGGGMGLVANDDAGSQDKSALVPEDQLGILFGSDEPMDYLVVASPHRDANCSLYSSTVAIDTNIPIGTGLNGIYNYTFGNVGAEGTYLSNNWKLVCEKPVWPQVELANDDNSNLFGHVQMRQYVWPEPTLTYLS